VRRAALALACALVPAACVPGNGAPGDAVRASAPPDTLRGVVEVVGSEPGATVALIFDEGRRAVTLEGERPLLDRLQGLEIVVRGERETGVAMMGSGTFRVDSFAVRASGEMPATDGVLVREGERYLLSTWDGRRLALEHVPADLRAREGAWVWIAGVPGRFPDSFGVIRESP
jgi:hypothetical protein